jgi:hypothetical protein
MIEKLDNIPVALDLNEISKKLRLDKTGHRDEVGALLKMVESRMAAGAVYRISYVEEKTENGVLVDGVKLTSRVLRKNLDDVGRVFPHVVTIGPGLDEAIAASEDLLEQVYLDEIGNAALMKARGHLEVHLRERYAIEGLSYMSPGSLKDWPLQEQRPLFSLLGDVEEQLGVRLTGSLLMIPRKSVSGIYFPTERSFYSCQLCPRKECQGRKAPFNATLAEEYGIS